MEPHNPFESLRELANEQRELKRRRLPDPIKLCTFGGDIACHHSPCLSIASTTTKQNDNDDNISYSCLQHFVSHVEIDQLLLECNVRLMDEEIFHSQTSGVNSMWKEAIGDLILQMYILQRKEESKLRLDPLSVLSHNPQQKQKELVKALGGPVAHHLQSTTSSIKSNIGNIDNTSHKKLTKINDMTNSSETYASNPYIRRDTDRSGSLFTGLNQASASLKRMEKIAAEEEAAAELAATTRCTNCGSAWVIERNSEPVDGTRGEIWGSKDVPSITYVVCKKCTHVATFK